MPVLPALAAVRLIKTARKRNPGLQLLLFSATFNEKIKNFAIRIAPRANQVSERAAAKHAWPS